MASVPSQLTLADMEEGDEYRAFLDKFKPKKTTDECHTPEPVYEAVLSWAERELGIDRDRVVRPFWPGADYTRAEYPDGCVVIDNPPFSILAQIVRDYTSWGIDFLLFAPSLTLFTSPGCCHLACDCDITYANGANVRTGFLTSLDPVNEVRTAPELTVAVMDAMKEHLRETNGPSLPKYVYPCELLTAARASWLSKWGADLRIAHDECVRVGTLDAQRAYGKSIFGGGYLLSERAAAERAAAERAAAERAAAKVWALSEREREIVKALGGGSHES